MLAPRLLVREQLVSEHEIGCAATLEELDGDEGFGRIRLVLPTPGVHQLLRRFHHTVHTDQVMLGAVRGAHVDAVFAAGAEVDLRKRRRHVTRGFPLFHLRGRRPRLEDALPRRREAALEPEGDGGLLMLSRGHADDSCAWGWAR